MIFLVYLLSLTVLAGASIYLFIFINLRKSMKWFESPSSEGKFVDSHGKRIFYRVRGKGEPVAVVIGDIGSSQAEWWPVQNEVGMKYRMITLDRPGYGWSAAQENPRTAANVSEELDVILKFERIKKPIFLIAQGAGTIYARYYAATHPQNVKGALFIDPMPLRYEYWLSTINDIDDVDNLSEANKKKKLKASKGFFRIFSPFKGYHLDMRYKRYIVEHYCRTENYDTAQIEISQIENVLGEIETAGDFPPIPLKVLYPANESLIRDWVKNGAPEYSARQLGRLHNELSRDILSLSPKSSILEVERSGEFIHLSKPDIVAQEILDLMKE